MPYPYVREPLTAEKAARLAGVREADPRPTLISSIDPANLYGAGAPLDIPLLEGGTARLHRSPTSSSSSRVGRSSSSKPTAGDSPDYPPTRRILRVETYNTAAALSGPAAPCLAEAGFVRDPPDPPGERHVSW